MFRSGKLLWLLLTLSVIFLSTAVVLSQQGQNQGQQRPVRREDRKPYKRWEWAFQQRSYPRNEIPEDALERAERELRQWEGRFLQQGLQPSPGRWVNIGPAPITGGQTADANQTRPVSGRVSDIAVDPKNPNHWLIGAAQGGVWETRDAGATWTPLTDNQASLAIGAVAFDPSNPQIIYAGTGEAPLGGLPYAGAGLLKSTDGGKNWQLLEKTKFAGLAFSDLKVDPKAPQTVLAALSAIPDGFGATKPPGTAAPGGVFKSKDGGVNWTRTLGGNNNATDLEPDPSNFNQQYAALGLDGGDPANGIYRSVNAGDNWALVNGPWTARAGGVGRVELAIAPSNPKVLYVSIHDARNGAGNDDQLLGVWRTADAWATPPVWEELTLDANLKAEPQWFYDHEIIVDVANANTLYVGGVHLWKAIDTTANPIVWEQIDNKPRNALHVDQQTMAWTQTPQTAMISMGKLPMSFEPNQGQADEPVKFLSRGQGYNLQLTATEAVLRLRIADCGLRIERGTEAPARTDNPQSSTRNGRNPQSAIRNHPQEMAAIIRMKLVGANKSPRINGQNQLPGKSNYYIGADQRRWRTGIPNYAAVRYDDVWPGIDLAYYGNQQQLEYDFIVAPGAHPKQIKLNFSGARKLSVSRKGDLVLRTRGGKIRLLKPVIYQEHNGVRKEIRGRYARRGKRQVGFRVAAYDRSLPLVIDPVLVYSTYLGGSFADAGQAIAVDAEGNAYVTGSTSSANFPLEKALDPSNTARERSAFVTKINAAGTALVYSTYLGGSSGDSGLGIAVDASGAAYVTGVTRSTDFPTRRPLQGALGGFDDGFVAKLNPAGSELLYSTYIGGSEEDGGQGIAVDSTGAAYLTGYSRSTNFPTANPVQPANAGAGNRDAFIAKLNPAGSALVYSTYLGGGSGDEGKGIAVDSTGAAYIVGQTFSTNFRTANPLQAASGGGSDAFAAKLNPAGSALVYSTYLGGGFGDEGSGIAVESSGAAYVTGRTDSTNFPVKNPLQAAKNGPQTDAFVAKINATGSALDYSTYLGGGNSDYGYGIAVDASGAAWVAGSTESADFPLMNALQTVSRGDDDVFVTRLNAAGSAFLFSTYLGGSGEDIGRAIALDFSGGVYVTGDTNSTDFRTEKPFQSSVSGVNDAFVTKLLEQTPARLVVGNDGGVWSTPDGGQTWDDHNTSLSITQFYLGSIHPANANAALGAGQDNGTAYWTGANPWRSVFGGDGAASAFSSASPDTHWMISASSLWITRTTDGGATLTRVDGGITGRTATNVPFIAQCEKCPANDNVFLAGTDSVWRTDNFFSSAPGLPAWTQRTASIGAQITAIALAPADNTCNTWAWGSRVGQLRVTRDGGATETNIDVGNTVPDRFITDLEFHPFDANTLYVTLSGFDETTPGRSGHIFKTTNALSANPAWRNISPPMNIPHNAVAIDSSNPEIIYVATDMGVWKSDNGGVSWEHFGPDKGMPNIAVFDIQVNARTGRIVAFTHGRGAFTLDRNRADLEVAKTANPDPVGIDEDLTYLLTVKNNGPDKATDVFLLDTLPAGVTYVTSSASQGACAGNSTSVSCQLGELNNGVTATVTIIVRPTRAGSITNMAQASSDEIDPNPANNKVTITTKVIAPATVKVERATKTCAPTDAYPRISPQPAAGPNFAAIPEQPPTQIKCVFDAEVTLDGIAGNTGPVNLTIFDGFSPGLFFDRLTASSPTLTVASYTNNILTFNPTQLALPPQTAFQRFRVSFEYFAFLNDLAEQRSPQQNCITLRFADPRNGKQVFERGNICADTNVLVPRLALEKYGSSTTGLPGDKLTFTVIALNGGNVLLESVDIDAIIPNNTTLVPDSVDPPPRRVNGNRIEWRGIGPLIARGALPVSYSVTIDANTPENSKLADQAFAYAVTPNFPGAGIRRLNASSNQVTVMVMPARTGVDLTLTAAPGAGCPLTTIDYNARITNTGQVTLDRLRLSLTQGTETVAGNPTFPLQLDPLGPGESRTISYKGRIGLKQKGTLVDVATIVGRPVNNGVQVSELVGRVATATVQVSPPAISKITPALGPPGSNNLELKIEGVCFVPETVVSFQPGAGILAIPPSPPDFGFIGTSELRRRINILTDAAPGEREVFVTNPNGDSGGQRPFNVFTVTSAATAIDAGPLSLDFAGVTTGQSKDLTLTVRSTGAGPLIINPIASNNPRFAVIAPAMPFAVAAGAQQNIAVRFSPTAAGAQSGMLTIPSNATNRPSLEVALTGAGVGSPDIAATPGALDFGSAAPGQNVARTLTINNPGNAALSVYAITSSNPNFGVTLPSAPLSVPAGGSAPLTANFTPTSVGAQTGALLIVSSAANKNTFAVQARGETPGGQTLATDDGTVETGALQDGLIILNRLTPPRYPVTLRSLRIFFAQFQNLPSPVGEQIRLIAFADPTGSGQPPANPQLVVNQMATIPAIPANGGFVDFPVTATFAFASDEGASSALTIESGDLYVGFQAPRPARGVVFAADSSGPQQQRAFFSTNDGASYAKLTGLQNPGGTITPVNIMTQVGIGGVGVCSYAINPSSQVFTDAGGSGAVTVTAPNGCAWTVSSKADWIIFNPNSGGSGNGAAGFSVAAGSTPRQAAVTIAGQPFTVAQAEKVASVSSASYRRLGLAGEAIAAAFGASLAATTQAAPSIPLPTSLAAATVKVRDAAGTELFAPLFFASPNQVNFLMPPGLIPGAATVAVTSGGTTSVGAVLNDVVAPGLFTANVSGEGVPAASVLRVRQDGAQIFESLVVFDATRNQFVPAPIDLGPESDQVFLLLFGTGWRYRSALSAVTCDIGGVNSEVLFAGAQGGFVGLDQMNVRLARNLAGRGEIDLVVTVDGRLANTVRINVK